MQTANHPANLGLHPDGGEAPRSRIPYGMFARKDPFHLGGPSFSGRLQRWSVTITIITTVTEAEARDDGDGAGLSVQPCGGARDHSPSRSCIQAGMSRWPYSTRQTSI